MKAGFESKWGIPQVCGAIDVTHVEVNLPGNVRSTDYYDKDKNYSFILQAIVDADSRNSFFEHFCRLSWCSS